MHELSSTIPTSNNSDTTTNGNPNKICHFFLFLQCQTQQVMEFTRQKNGFVMRSKKSKPFQNMREEEDNDDEEENEKKEKRGPQFLKS